MTRIQATAGRTSDARPVAAFRLLAGALSLGALAGCAVLPEPAPAAGDGLTTSVVRIIDGDTVAVQPTDQLPATDDAGAEHVVRILGIDAPEMNHTGDQDPECGAEDATEHLAELLPDGSEVAVMYDEKADKSDRYGRSLAYIESPDVDDAGLSMVTAGHAAPWVPQSEPEPARFSTYEAAMRDAQAAGAGGWAQCPTIGRAGATA